MIIFKFAMKNTQIKNFDDIMSDSLELRWRPQQFICRRHIELQSIYTKYNCYLHHSYTFLSLKRKQIFEMSNIIEKINK